MCIVNRTIHPFSVLMKSEEWELRLMKRKRTWCLCVIMKHKLRRSLDVGRFSKDDGLSLPPSLPLSLPPSLDAISLLLSHSTWQWVVLLLARQELVKLRPPKILGGLWASWFMYSTALNKWTTRYYHLDIMAFLKQTLPSPKVEYVRG